VDRSEMEAVFARGDIAGLVEGGRTRPSSVITFLSRRIASDQPQEKWRAVSALGAMVQNPQVVNSEKVTELLRRFFWALNDESGAVPHGVPEAIAEVLSVRPEQQEVFLPKLCALLTEEELQQTGAIERGAVWAMGRLGRVVGERAPDAVFALEILAREHEDPETRALAERALHSVKKR